MSETLVQRPTPVHDLPSREIINVDEFAFNNIYDGSSDDVQLISHAPGRRSQEPIVIDDSDDDVEIVAGPSRPSPANAPVRRPSNVRRPMRRVLFSPSPPPQDNYIPPVPPLPPYARAGAAFRWQGSPDFAGVIRPPDRPLAFEEGFQAQPRLASTGNAPQQVQPAAAEASAAPRPNIGFGGALFAFNRRNRFEPAYPAVPPARGEHDNGGWRNFLNNLGLGAYRRFFQRANGSDEPRMLEIEDDVALLEALAFDAEERHPEDRFRLYTRPFINRHASPQHRKVELDYKPTFTHPAKPEAGFSNDFAPQEAITISDDPGPSSVHVSEVGTVLVCARCFDPLVMNVMGSDDEVRKRRLFALRCGHMLDGKCIDTLMKPPPASDPGVVQSADVSTASSSKGKGKEETTVGDEEREPFQPGTSGIGFSPKRDNKGKQRAVETGADVERLPTKRKAAPPDAPATSTEYTRSRLRPRHGDGDTLTTSPTLASPLHLAPSGEVSLPVFGNPGPSGRVRSRQGRRQGGASGRGKGKGKGKKKAASPFIEAEYEWACPVTGCAHMHKSVLIGGVWRMAEARGAIPLYV